MLRICFLGGPDGLALARWDCSGYINFRQDLRRVGMEITVWGGQYESLRDSPMTMLSRVPVREVLWERVLLLGTSSGTVTPW